MRRSRSARANCTVSRPLSPEALCRAIAVPRVLADGATPSSRVISPDEANALLCPYLGDHFTIRGLLGESDTPLHMQDHDESICGIDNWADDVTWLVPMREAYALFDATGPADLMPALAALRADPWDLVGRMARLVHWYGPSSATGLKADCWAAVEWSRDLVAAIIGGDDPLPPTSLDVLWRGGLGVKPPYEWSIGQWAGLTLVVRDMGDLMRLAVLLDRLWLDDALAEGVDVDWYRSVCAATNRLVGDMPTWGRQYGATVRRLLIDGDGPWSLAGRIGDVEPAAGDPMTMQRAVWALLLAWRRFLNAVGRDSPKCVLPDAWRTMLNPRRPHRQYDEPFGPLVSLNPPDGQFDAWWSWFLARRWLPGRIKCCTDGILLAHLMALPAPVLVAAVAIAHDIAAMMAGPGNVDIALDRFSAGPNDDIARLYFDGIALGRLAPLLRCYVTDRAEHQAAEAGQGASDLLYRVEWFYGPASMLSVDVSTPVAVGMLHHQGDAPVRLVFRDGMVVSEGADIGPVPLDIASAMSSDQMRDLMAEVARALAAAASRPC